MQVRRAEEILQDIPHKIVQLPAKAILLDAGNIATDIFFVKTGCLRSWFNADGIRIGNRPTTNSLFLCSSSSTTATA